MKEMDKLTCIHVLHHRVRSHALGEKNATGWCTHRGLFPEEAVKVRLVVHAGPGKSGWRGKDKKVEEKSKIGLGGDNQSGRWNPWGRAA